MIKENYKCLSCGITHKDVECLGMFYCPNALCLGAGGAWFRSKLDSYVNHGTTHTVDNNELLIKGALSNKSRGIRRKRFKRI